MMDNGVETRPSRHSAEVTTKKLEAAVTASGFVVFGRLDHADAAANCDLKMPYSTVVVFGNPKMGTPNFVDNPPLALDLPLKALVWEDLEGKVWLSYNSSNYFYNTIYQRHGQSFTPEMVSWLDSWYESLMQEIVDTGHQAPVEVFKK
jgi:uncharacterized protein (DUF302 family)